MSDATKIQDAPAPAGPTFAATMVVAPMFKLITRADGSIILEGDPPDGAGAVRLEVPAAHSRAFLHFLTVAGRAGLELRDGPAWR